MVLATKPELKIVDKQKLHISRRPGIIAWLLLVLSLFVFIVVSSHLTDNIFVLIITILGEIMFGLDTLGEWEDLILDKEQNTATITRCTWCYKLCSRVPKKSITVMKLSDIRHVGVSTDLGLFVLYRNGKTATLTTHGLTRNEIQNLKKEINYFLNMSRIEHLDRFPIDPYDRLIMPSDSEDEFTQNLPMKRRAICILKNSPVSNPTQVSDDQISMRCSVQQQFSTPSLSCQRENHNGQQVNLRRGPYTDNSLVHRTYPRCMRHRCMPSDRLEVAEAI